MQFNTGQMQELAGVRREQLRHWRKVLPPLEGRDGRADSYTFAEVMALAVIREAVDGLGMPVTRLKTCAGDVFALFADLEDFGGLPELLFVSSDGELTAADAPNSRSFAAIRVSILFAQVRERLAPEIRRQLSLPLMAPEMPSRRPAPRGRSTKSRGRR